MDAPGTVTLMAFNTEVGSSKCPPVTVTLNDSDNSTEVADTRKKLASEAPGAVGPYLDCVRASALKDGTDVFGGFAQAATLLSSSAAKKSIVFVTDGCSYGYGAGTCSKNVVDPKWRAKAIAGLPATLKPSLAGTDVTIVGLARGTHLRSDEVQGLRSFYEEYAKTIGANLTIED
jgi:hypothetical protein